MDESDDDDDLFADFNAEDEDFSKLEGMSISSNLIADAGVKQARLLHEGEADEGAVTWVAPKFYGLHNSASVSDASGSHWYRDEAEDELWGELLGDDDEDGDEGGATNVSENLLTMPPEPVPTVVEEVAEERRRSPGRRMSEALIDNVHRHSPAPADASVLSTGSAFPASAMAPAAFPADGHMLGPAASSGGGAYRSGSTLAQDASGDGTSVTPYVPAADAWLLSLQRRLFEQPAVLPSSQGDSASRMQQQQLGLFVPPTPPQSELF